MIKPDEVTFLMILQLRCKVSGQDGGETPRAIIADSLHLLSEKRALYLLKKWTGTGWYDYGTCIDLGWLTKAGKAATLQKEWEAQQ